MSNCVFLAASRRPSRTHHNLFIYVWNDILREVIIIIKHAAVTTKTSIEIVNENWPFCVNARWIFIASNYFPLVDWTQLSAIDSRLSKDLINLDVINENKPINHSRNVCCVAARRRYISAYALPHSLSMMRIFSLARCTALLRIHIFLSKCTFCCI